MVEDQVLKELFHLRGMGRKGGKRLAMDADFTLLDGERVSGYYPFHHLVEVNKRKGFGGELRRRQAGIYQQVVDDGTESVEFLPDYI